MEELLEDNEHIVPSDYKFYVFHDHVEYVHLDFDRFGDPSRQFIDQDCNPQPFRKGGVPLGPVVKEPSKYHEMIDIAETLADSFDFVRVYLHLLNDNRIVFGEITVRPFHGRSLFSPEEWDTKFGQLW